MIDVFEHPVVIGYPVGAGGNRLRRMLLGFSWAIEPQNHLHHRISDHRKYSIDDGVPKFPWPDSIELEDPAHAKYPVLITHCMNSQTLRRVFPNRKIVKVYCDFYLAMRRHWQVYAREMTQANIRKHNGGAILPMDIQNVIRWNLDYYRDNIDFTHDHAVYIEPGRGEFEDFMWQEFLAIREPEFEQEWHTVAAEPQYTELANLPMIRSAMSAVEKP